MNKRINNLFPTFSLLNKKINNLYPSLSLILVILLLPISLFAEIHMNGLGKDNSNHPSPSFQLLVFYFLLFIFYFFLISFLSFKGIKKAKNLNGDGKKLSIFLLILALIFLLPTIFRLYQQLGLF